jgi:hypothetical protein
LLAVATDAANATERKGDRFIFDVVKGEIAKLGMAPDFGM